MTEKNIPQKSDDQKAADRRFIQSFLQTFGLFTAVGMQLAVSVVLGLLGGKYLDDKLGTTPILLLIGLTLGTTAGFYNLVRILNQQKQRRNDDDISK